MNPPRGALEQVEGPGGIGADFKATVTSVGELEDHA